MKFIITLIYVGRFYKCFLLVYFYTLNIIGSFSKFLQKTTQYLGSNATIKEEKSQPRPSGEKCQNLTELEIFCCWDRVFKTKSPYGAYGGEFKGTWKHFCPVGILTHILSLFPQLWHFFHLTSPLFYWAVILIIVTVFIRQAVKSTRHPKKLADQH